MACDICLKTGETESLNGLLRFGDVTQICYSCAEKSNKLLDKYRHMAWVRCKKKLKHMYKEARK